MKELLSKLTLEEKASLCSGQDFWHLKGIERLNIPEIMVTDGPHGLRKQGGESDHVGINKSVPATCFPTASTTACSWDPELMYKMGVALGEECLQENVSVLLGPGANIKRSPLCGRNFEYISEDPFLTGKIGAGLVNGVQSQGVGTSLKHFVANNQEFRRMVIDTIVDERALREIYLAGFETVIKTAQPWTVMCSYNKINGTYASDHKRLLTDILKNEWGHTGLVVTDWGAMNDRVEGIKAGLEVEMPASGGLNDRKIVEAVKSGELSEEALDQVVIRILGLINKTSDKKGIEYDVNKHHELARRIAAESSVLLKNDKVLPLKDEKIAVVGGFAQTPRFQGAGSSLINPVKLETALDELDRRKITYVYHKGYDLETDLIDQKLIDDAMEICKDVDKIVVYVGLTDEYESEGFDRTHLNLPKNHDALIEALVTLSKPVILVLHNGAPVEMPWINQVSGVLETYLGGQAGGPASIDLLYGDVNPSGKLAETFPLRLEDDLASRYFGMGPQSVEYRESVFVGYRYYDTKKQAVLFPFGYGLSYTTFEYEAIELDKLSMTDDETLQVKVTIKNSGEIAGAEVVQLYVKDVETTIFRPEKELKAFKKVYLEAGESCQIVFDLDRRAFAFYNVNSSDWHVESGDFDILIGKSSADICLKKTLEITSTSDAKIPCYDLKSYQSLETISGEDFEALLSKPLQVNKAVKKGDFTINSTLEDVKSTFVGKKLYKTVMGKMTENIGDTDERQIRMMEHIVNDMPLRSMVLLGGDQFNFELADGLLDLMNGKNIKGALKILKSRKS